MSEDPLDNEIPVNHTQPANDHDNVIFMIEPSQEWTDRRDLLANEMFNSWTAMHMADSNIVRVVTRSKHTWTNDEDAKLIDALMEIHASGKYAGADNGFKPGYLNGVQQLLDSHKGAVNFRDKAFPFYDKLCTIFGKDRATGSKAVDLGEEDVVQETQKSSPVDIEDFDFVDEVVPNVDRSEGQTGSVTSKRKRGRSTDADEIYRESCKDIKEVLLRFGEMVGEQLSKEGMEAREIYEKVSDELKALPGITTKKRFKAAHLIGKDVDLGRSLLALTIEEKIEMVELYTDGSMG
ncbi:hypothetical protein E3N88_10734 [Mikania micrantha]|uniref:Myb/SANT-like domain-containing protein n=1 Tax=Mikania micrantha TaxID=192012 RepID=A0A5N6PBQ4_9ASTR|nr:hypothetical protein E3N88_10734 [Mikania micrantha]